MKSIYITIQFVYLYIFIFDNNYIIIFRKYLRDNEREDISKEALFLSVQILGKIKSEYAETNIRSKNELLLIQVYKSYKRVFKCWQQKDKTLSKLLLNVYQNIIGSKVRLIFVIYTIL